MSAAGGRVCASMVQQKVGGQRVRGHERGAGILLAAELALQQGMVAAVGHNVWLQLFNAEKCALHEVQRRITSRATLMCVLEWSPALPTLVTSSQ